MAHPTVELVDDNPGAEAGAKDAAAEDVLVVDVLVEEVSIDGMCGVY